MPKIKLKLTLYQKLIFTLWIVINSVHETTQAESDSQLETVEYEEENFGPFLYKCSSSQNDSDEILQEFLTLPDFLRFPYPAKLSQLRLTNFARIFDTDVESLYNFTLISKNFEEGQSGGGGCMDGTFLLKIPSKSFDPSQVVSFNFTPDGWLGYYKNSDNWEDGVGRREEIYFPRENYCIHSITPDHVVVKVCKSQCYMNPEMERGDHPCIPKCCRLGRVMTLENCRVAMETNWMPTLYPHVESLNVTQNTFPNLYHNHLEYYWNCTKHESEDIHLRHKPNELRILTNGAIYLQNKFDKNLLIKEYPRMKVGGGGAGGFGGGAGNHVDFCIDGFWNRSATTIYFPELNVHWSWTCQPNIDVQKKMDNEMQQNFATKYLQIMFGVTLVSSLIHLTILAIYTILLDKQNIQGLTVMTFTLVQFMLNLLRTIFMGIFGFDHSAPDSLSDRGSVFYKLCVGSGILFHFLLISSFSWTTVISFDVWHKIRSMRPTSTSSKRIKRFLGIYCGFGFGLPAVVVGISILMEFTIGDAKMDHLIRPGYQETCVISEFWPYFYYVSLMITCLFLTNMALVILTLKSILEAKKDVKDLSNSEISSNFKNNASLIGKLFILMGIFLLFEIGIALWNPAIKISVYFISLDFYRILHAAALFRIFVWNKKTGHQLLEKIPILQNYLKFSSPATSSTADPQSTPTGIATTKSPNSKQ